MVFEWSCCYWFAFLWRQNRGHNMWAAKEFFFCCCCCCCIFHNISTNNRNMRNHTITFEWCYRHAIQRLVPLKLSDRTAPTRRNMVYRNIINNHRPNSTAIYVKRERYTGTTSRARPRTWIHSPLTSLLSLFCPPQTVQFTSTTKSMLLYCYCVCSVFTNSLLGNYSRMPSNHK